MDVSRKASTAALIVAACFAGFGTTACTTPGAAPTVKPDAPSAVTVDIDNDVQGWQGVHGALGFTLTETTRATVVSWAAEHGLQCEQRSAGRWMHCVNVPGGAVGQLSAPAIDALDLRFDGGGRLWQVQAKRKNVAPADASRFFAHVSSALEARVGAPSETIGDAAPAPRQRSAREFRASGLRAQVVASHLGSGSVLLLETYSSRS